MGQLEVMICWEKDAFVGVGDSPCVLTSLPPRAKWLLQVGTGGDCVLQAGRPGARSPDGFHQTPNITLQFVLTGSPNRLSSFTVK